MFFKKKILPDDLKAFFRRFLIRMSGISVIAIGVLIFIALFSYHATDPSWNMATGEIPENILGHFGANTADFCWQFFGISSVLIPLGFLVWGGMITRLKRRKKIILSVLFFTPTLLSFMIFFSAVPLTLHWPVWGKSGGAVVPILYRNCADFLTIEPFFVYPGIILIPLFFILSIFLLFLTLGVPLSVIKVFVVKTFKLFLRHPKNIQPVSVEAFGENIPESILPIQPVLDLGFIEPETTPIEEEKQKPQKPSPLKSIKEHKEYQTQFHLPKLDFLATPKIEKEPLISKESMEQNARRLEAVLEEFGVKGKIVNVRPGPVVTLYELEPAAGVKTTRVINLADDIARSMSAISVRIAVIPGQNVIGIEMPNEKRAPVFLKEMLSNDVFKNATKTLTLALGKDISGKPTFADLAKMPHLLIAGTTGSGKSVGINTMIVSLLYRLTPEQCRLIMIDPKMLELSVYNGIPHLLSPVVTDPKKAIVALNWAVREMDDRYLSMSQMGVRNIEGYNKKVVDIIASKEPMLRTIQTGFDEETGAPIYEQQEMVLKPFPYIVVVVDEMADLMLTAGKEIEVAIQRIAQKARASGIHLIMATQRPSVDVITGTIKANFPERISFRVTTKIDSRTIMGEQGAEQLLGMGDMLYLAQGQRAVRLHGPFVSDEEVETITNHLRSQAEPEYVKEVTEEPAEGSDSMLSESSDSDEENSLYDKAVNIVLKDRKVSTSYVQRQLRIGYNRAADLIDQMEAQGVISKPNHAGKREILVPDNN